MLLAGLQVPALCRRAHGEAVAGELSKTQARLVKQLRESARAVGPPSQLQPSSDMTGKAAGRGERVLGWRHARRFPMSAV